MLAATMTRAGLPTYYYSATSPPIVLMTDENEASLHIACTVFHRDLEAFGAFVISD